MPSRFVHFADPYRVMIEKQCRGIAACGVDNLANRAYAAMLFWTTKVHERAGTNPLFPSFHRQAIQESLARPSNRSFSDAVKAERFAQTVWQKFRHKTKRDGKEYANKKLTFGPVKGILVKLKRAGEPNVVKWLTSMDPEEAWEALQEKPIFNGIGPKLASFVLRDIAVFCNGWQGRIANNGKFFQPVDRWVLRCSRSVWPQEPWPRDVGGGKADYLRLAEQIVNNCGDEIEAMNFNMGAWFVNAKFEDIMSIHGVLYCGETLSSGQRLELTSLFDAERISRAISCDPKEMAERIAG